MSSSACCARIELLGFCFGFLAELPPFPDEHSTDGEKRRQGDDAGQDRRAARDAHATGCE